MSFRARLTLYVAAAIAVTVSAASVAVWVVAKHELLTQFDRALYEQVNGGRGLFGHTSLYVTLIRPDGTRGPGGREHGGAVPLAARPACARRLPAMRHAGRGR